MSRRSAFTLVELMIVVAIISILSAVAIPAFHEMQLRARRAEVSAVTEGIMRSAVAYHADNASVVMPTNSDTPNPRDKGDLDKSNHPWRGGEATLEEIDMFEGSGSRIANFDAIGFEPDGMVRCTYAIGIDHLGDDMIVGGGCCDLDDDNAPHCYDATQPMGGGPGTQGVRAGHESRY